MSTFLPKIKLILIGFLCSGLANAVVVDRLFQSSLEIQSQQNEDRQEGFNRALVQILIKLTGQRGLAESPEINTAFFPAERYVQSYSYKENPAFKAFQKALLNVSSNDLGASALDNSKVLDKESGTLESDTLEEPLTQDKETPLPLPYILEVEFSPSAIQQKMKVLNLPVWGKIRPEIMLWILQEYVGERNLLGTQSAPEELDLIRPIAKDFALPISFPEADEQDLSSLVISDVWGLFPDALDMAKSRYPANGHMMVRMLKSLDQNWSANISLFLNNQNFRAVFVGETKEEIYSQVIEYTASSVSTLFAVNANSANSQLLELEVQDVKSFISYVDVQEFLSQSPQVKNCALTAFKGTTMFLSCELISSFEKFNDFLNLSGKVRFISATQEIPVVPSDVVTEQTTAPNANMPLSPPAFVIKEVYQWLISPPDLK